MDYSAKKQVLKIRYNGGLTGLLLKTKDSYLFYVCDGGDYIYQHRMSGYLEPEDIRLNLLTEYNTGKLKVWDGNRYDDLLYTRRSRITSLAARRAEAWQRIAAERIRIETDLCLPFGPDPDEEDED